MHTRWTHSLPSLWRRDCSYPYFHMQQAAVFNTQINLDNPTVHCLANTKMQIDTVTD